MNIRTLIAGTLSALPLGAAAQSDQKPNFVIILADDMGYGDIRPYGNTSINTPSLDRLAREGMLFTDFHSNGAVSTPTRCALLTGRYQQRAGLEKVLLVEGPMDSISGGLPPGEVTFARVMADEGYRTALFGKWHLGYQARYAPENFGFQIFEGFKSGNVDYHSHRNRSGEHDWWQGSGLRDRAGYTTTVVSDLSCEFIRENSDRPFCLYIAHGAPHSPLQGPLDESVRDGVSKRDNAPQRPLAEIYKDMIEELDRGVGKVMETLRKCGIEQNTLVVFMSDNGPVTRNGGSTAGLRGEKGSPWEGGHRVPAIFSMPGSIVPGSACNTPAAGFDIFPTIVQLAGIEYDNPEKPMDGTSVVPLLRGSDIEPRLLFWGVGGGGFAVRDGNWKLVLNSGETMLFDLAVDRDEQYDLAAQNPGKVEIMVEELEKWKKSVYNEIPDQL